jgi:biopolymer transport protein TolQ
MEGQILSNGATAEGVLSTDVMALTAQHAAQFSFFDLFWQADWVVKLVILSLLVCSVVCWAIIIQKGMQLGRVSRLAKEFEQRFWSGTSIPSLVEAIGNKPQNPLESILLRCFDEWQRSRAQIGFGQGEMTVQRIAALARITIDQEIQNSSRGLSLLATFGSACPFIGLFGTVWGIMNSFSAIAASKQTSLAVVAPGIAEALFATALGLVAAIPATVAYNKFVGDVDRQAQNNEQFASEVIAIFSRQITDKR